MVESDIKTKDSEDMLDVLMGKSQKGRDEFVLEATSRTAFRKGDWVMIPPYKGAARNKMVNIELGNSREALLYNLSSDLSQQNNLAPAHPDKLKEMVTAFEEIRGQGYKKVEALELK